MRKELDYVQIDGALGGSQDWLREWDMHRGGCAAVTACDLCIYLAGRAGFPGLYPYDLARLNKEDFIRFAQVMKPYLAPRFHGVDFLETYLCGLSDYWRDVGYQGLGIEGLSGTVPLETAEAMIRVQIDEGFPIPCLTLYHQDPAFEDFEWHWYNLVGYDESPEGPLVKAVTYGEPEWLNLAMLWNTGEERRGGLIRIFRR